MLWNLGRGAASTSYCWRSAAHRGGLVALGQRRGGVARAGKSQRGGARAAGELGDDAWSGAGAVVGLGRHGNSSGRWRCRAAEEVEEEEE
jgi:hypothetical protein